MGQVYPSLSLKCRTRLPEGYFHHFQVNYFPVNSRSQFVMSLYQFLDVLFQPSNNYLFLPSLRFNLPKLESLFSSPECDILSHSANFLGQVVTGNHWRGGGNHRRGAGNHWRGGGSHWRGA